jgi:drug/metabolite transporter, DME family
MSGSTVEPSLSLRQGRLYVVAAALLWSLSGAFKCLLINKHVFDFQLGPNDVNGESIAFYRALFAGVFLTLLLRRKDVSFRPLMLLGAAFFALMNITFVLALAWGKASNAILLQYTAPMWMYIASIWLLGEKADRRSTFALALGLAGIAAIIIDGWTEAHLNVILIALVSGFAFAGVMICLRVLRNTSPRWLTVFNHLVAALVMVPALCWLGWQELTWPQLGVLVLFGIVQMGLPYLLVSRGLKVVSPQEAATITLLEPLLNPLWAFLVSPSTETPSVFTFVGGAFIVGALAYRYWPWRRRDR